MLSRVKREKLFSMEQDRLSSLYWICCPAWNMFSILVRYNMKYWKHCLLWNRRRCLVEHIGYVQIRNLICCHFKVHGLGLGFCGILIVYLSWFHSCSFLFSLVGIYLNLRSIYGCWVTGWGGEGRGGECW